MIDEINSIADKDTDGRKALWKAICVASDDVQTRFSVKCILSNGTSSPCSRSPVPDVFTWQLVEALSLLCRVGAAQMEF